MDSGELNGGPVFVVGMNGSGTTMLLDRLGQHPELFAFPLETHVLPFFMRSERRYGDLADDANFHRLWEEMRSAYSFQTANKGQPVELPEDWRDTRRSAAAVFDRLVRVFAARQGKDRWAEKTPMHVLHMIELSEAFPGSRFVHMIRDGRDCAASNHRRWGRHAEGTMYRWKQVIREARRQGELLDSRYLELKYEEVTTNPDQCLASVCEFLDLEFDSRILLSDKRRRDVSRYESKKIVRSQSASRGYFSESRYRNLERIGGRVLAELGYPTSQPDSDLEPSGLRRRWWLAHDTARVGFRHVHKKLTKRKNLSWRLVFSRWIAIVRNWKVAKWNRS
jgi:hypothetical protein